MTKPTKTPVLKTITKNRKASMRFTVMEAFEAGVVLAGHEVKSLRQGRISIEEGLIRVLGNEMFLMNVHIPPYSHLTQPDYQPTRSRKLLMHRKEIMKLENESQVKGMTLIPLELYFKNGKVKVTVGLAKGKQTGDHREEIKKRETNLEIRRAIK